MSRNDLAAYLARSPFEPFRIITSDGPNYEVHHPEMVIASPTSAVIAYPDPERTHAATGFDLVSMRHIVRLENLSREVAADASGNGE